MYRSYEYRRLVALLTTISIVWLVVAIIVMPTQRVQAEESVEEGDHFTLTASDTTLSIGEARETANTVTVAVYGEITSLAGTGNGWIQDETAGIRMYRSGGLPSQLSVGQEVFVQGELSEYNGDKQVVVSTIEPTGRDDILTPEPLVVSIAEVAEENEGQLVTVKDVWVTGNYTSGNGGIRVTDGTNTLVIYAQPGRSFGQYLQSLPKSEDSKFDITGVSSEYRGTRQLMPRGEADILPVESEEPEPAPEGHTAKVVSISDGDTIKIEPSILGADIVRLLSIDTPEAYYMGQDQEPHAGQASDRLKELLPIGTEIRVVPGEESVDAYGRLLAHIYVGDTDINEEMIRFGHAVPYFIAPNLDHFEEYRAAYIEAEEAERGIWNTDDPLEQLPYEFRFTLRGCPDKYVGDYETKQYVIPSRWDEVETGNRVFFFTKADAIAAGYTPLDPADPDAEPCADPEAELITIAEARGQESGTTVRVQGEVTAVFPSNAWIDDGEAGIRLFGNEASDLTAGEEVEVVGTLTDFYGDLEITYPNVTRLTGEDRFDPPGPKSFDMIAEAGESDAGRLIQLNNVMIKEDYTASAGGVIITDGTSEMIVYAQAGPEMKAYLQELPKDKVYHFTGVAAVFHGNIQIFPRDESDIVEADMLTGGSLTGRVLAEGRDVHSAIVLELTDQESGEVVSYSDVVADDGAFTIEGLEPSVYGVRALLEHYVPVTVTDVTISADQGADIGLLSSEASGGTSEGKMRAGDIVSDGVIDVYDAVIVGAHYEQTSEVALQAADVNGDGIVDSGDLDLVSRNMLFFTNKE